MSVQKGLQNFKNPGKHDILMATSERIHTYVWNVGEVAKVSGRKFVAKVNSKIL
jgi:hypothetical protein